MAGKEVLLSERPGSSGGGMHNHNSMSGPEPPSGLGNFKGVMLCHRPADQLADKGDSGGPGPFKSTISPTQNDMVGVNPVKHVPSAEPVKRTNEALNRHVAWLKKLQESLAVQREGAGQNADAEAAKKTRVKAFCEKQRAAVREMMAERNEKQPVSDTRAQLEKVVKAKPKWALTEEALKNAEDADTDDLLSFAENLNFDDFIEDIEFRQAVCVMKDRAGKLGKEELKFKEDLLAELNEDDEEDDVVGELPTGAPDGIEGQSVCGSESVGSISSRRSERSKRLNSDGRPEWDASTSVSESRIDEDKEDMVQHILANNPHMGKVHSAASVRKMIDQTSKDIRDVTPTRLGDVIEAPGPVIAVCQEREPVAQRPVDPSNMPYLYRNPAV